MRKAFVLAGKFTSTENTIDKRQDDTL